MRILLVFDRTQISEKRKLSNRTMREIKQKAGPFFILFGVGSFGYQPKSPIAVRPASPFFGIYRSPLTFIKHLIWVHMDQAAFELLSTRAKEESQRPTGDAMAR